MAAHYTCGDRCRQGARHGSSLAVRPSHRLDAGGADHLAPGREFGLDPRGELVGRAADGIEPERRQALLHVGLGEDVDDLAIERGNDVLRCARGRDEPDPAVALDAGMTRFRQGGTSGSVCARAALVTASARTLLS